MFGRVAYDKENIFINGTKVIGVISFDASLDFSRVPVTTIGGGYGGQTIDGEMPKSFSFSKYIYDSELDLINMIGTSVPCVFKYQSSENSTSSQWQGLTARLISYELKCEVGGIPESMFTFDVVGEAGFDESVLTNETGHSVALNIVRPGDLVFEGSPLFDLNRLQSVTYKFDAPLKKNNLIGGDFNPLLANNEPIEINIAFSFDLDSAGEEISTNDICDNQFSGTFVFNKCGDELRNFAIEDAELTDAQVNGAVGSNATFSCTYRSYVDTFAELKELVT